MRFVGREASWQWTS